MPRTLGSFESAELNLTIAQRPNLVKDTADFLQPHRLYSILKTKVYLIGLTATNPGSRSSVFCSEYFTKLKATDAARTNPECIFNVCAHGC